MVDEVQNAELSERREGEAREGADEVPHRPAAGGAAEAAGPDAGERCAEAEAAAKEAGAAPEPDLATELAQARAQAETYLDQWRRTAADFANYRKRTEREREEMGRFANSLLIGRLLPVLDDLERAMATLSPDLRRFTWTDGVWLIARKLEAVLEGEGLKRIEAVGKPFDPERHEAVIREETTAYPEGQV
ncbi:MAG: nucleotide exchange factor GrpE, partial [Anaerolineae bacterium]|nr:nucleotide exchange factor GrpE [Anaerolineae bacterium]